MATTALVLDMALPPFRFETPFAFALHSLSIGSSTTPCSSLRPNSASDSGSTGVNLVKEFANPESSRSALPGIGCTKQPGECYCFYTLIVSQTKYRRESRAEEVMSAWLRPGWSCRIQTH